MVQFDSCFFFNEKNPKKHYQVVIRSDSKQFPEVAESHRGVRFKPEVRKVVGWCEVAALAATTGCIK